ncbi:MAG TPA: DUF167 domain-containing protein [Candidatus Acidoferrales bacterium]|nr:DUF167 domain-containing protein [Candidatus Acidoferrales bacterium]
MLDAKLTRDGAVRFAVRVAPGARRNALAGVAAGALRVRVAAPAVEGRANDALCRFLADCLNLPPAAVRIVFGERSRLKRVAVRGASLDRVLGLARDNSP